MQIFNFMCNKELLCAIQFIIIVAAYLLLVLRLMHSTYCITAVLVNMLDLLWSAFVVPLHLR